MPPLRPRPPAQSVGDVSVHTTFEVTAAFERLRGAAATGRDVTSGTAAAPGGARRARAESAGAKPRSGGGRPPRAATAASAAAVAALPNLATASLNLADCLAAAATPVAATHSVTTVSLSVSDLQTEEVHMKVSARVVDCD